MEGIFDAIILGAGINGCAIARKLAREGKRPPVPDTSLSILKLKNRKIIKDCYFL